MKQYFKYVRDVHFVLLPAKNPQPFFREFYDKAFQCWREVWEPLLGTEITKKTTFYSDDFTRQDEIACIFFREECVGLVFLRWVDLNNLVLRDDSFFKLWPQEAMEKLASHGPRAIVNSNFTIHQKYRKNAMDFSWKNLLGNFSHKRFLYSGQDVMAGQLRVRKGMNKVGEKTGVNLIMSGVPTIFDAHPDEAVDLIAIYPENPVMHIPGVTEVMEDAWQRVTTLAKPVLDPDFIKVQHQPRQELPGFQQSRLRSLETSANQKGRMPS